MALILSLDLSLITSYLGHLCIIRIFTLDSRLQLCEIAFWKYTAASRFEVGLLVCLCFRYHCCVFWTHRLCFSLLLRGQWGFVLCTYLLRSFIFPSDYWLRLPSRNNFLRYEWIPDSVSFENTIDSYFLSNISFRRVVYLSFFRVVCNWSY